MILLPMSGESIGTSVHLFPSAYVPIHLLTRSPVWLFTCPSVRYKLCQLLPRLRSSLRLPADKQLLQQLDFCVQKLLCREKDKDVVATIRKVPLT